MNIRLVTLHLLGNFSVARGGGEGGGGQVLWVVLGDQVLQQIFIFASCSRSIANSK